MKKVVVILLTISIVGRMFSQSVEQYPVYEGKDLGLNCSKDGFQLKVWAPSASALTLKIYKNGNPKTADANDLVQKVSMLKKDKGVWEAVVKGYHIGKFYTVQATIGGKEYKEVPDPYCKALGVNGLRGAILDPNTVNPSQWQKDVSPPFLSKTDAILYELHIRDASIAANSGIQNKGKYIGLTETGRKNSFKQLTGLSHIKQLGVTHVHLLPCFDFYSVDESRLNEPQFNWGYDPLNYNTPEGSYSTNPEKPEVRIKEFKEMVAAFHKNGLRVVMDVVYNHTMFNDESVFSQLVPDYYYRMNPDGKYSNASGCGNETASERPMVRKFILESLEHWVKTYHIDGFRFDLMGIHDQETMNLISKHLHKIKPDILLYGEGWTSGDSPLEESKRTLKKYVLQVDKVAAFSDDMRDGIKGSVFDFKDRGFVSGKEGMEESVKFGIVASGKHPQVDYSKVNYSKAPWTKAPYQCINYAECHDNHTLWDRLLNSNPNDTEQDKAKMHLLAQSVFLTAQGIPFLQAGMEFMRTKKGEENSFKSPDSINAIDWDRKNEFKKEEEYIKNIIALRKTHPAFRMSTEKMIAEKLNFINMPAQVIGFDLIKNANGDVWKTIRVVHNAKREPLEFTFSEKNWNVVLLDFEFDLNATKSISSDKVVIPPLSTAIFCKK